MARERKTSDAVEILHRRFVKDDPVRLAALEAERVNAQVARLIHELRAEAGLSQKELAEMIGTTQSVISRLEDANYEGHSLSMLSRIAKALSQKLTVVMTAKEPEDGVLRFMFKTLVQNLRREKALTIDELAKRTGIDRGELLAMERIDGYRPAPLSLHRLAEYYKIPARRIAELAGAIRHVPASVKEVASRFAAKSESFSELTKEEKQLLDEFVGVLKADADVRK